MNQVRILLYVGLVILVILLLVSLCDNKNQRYGEKQRRYRSYEDYANTPKSSVPEQPFTTGTVYNSWNTDIPDRGDVLANQEVNNKLNKLNNIPGQELPLNLAEQHYLAKNPNTFIPQSMDPFDQTPGHPHFNMNKSNCPVEPTELQMDKYIKDVVFSYPNINYSPLSYTKSQIDQQRNKFLDFNKYINNTSGDQIDAVDKVQQLYYSDNNDLSRSNYGCAKIKDLYDGLTTLPSNHCKNNLDPRVKNVFANNDLTGNFGKQYEDDFWKYKNERVDNGGDFFDHVQAHDDNAHYQMEVGK